VPFHALDAVDDAVVPTRALVTRLGVGDWLKLGVVTAFVGGAGSASFSANLPREALAAVPEDPTSLAGPGGPLLTAAAVGVGLLAVAGWLLARSLLAFVFYETLRRGTVPVRRSLARWWRHGVGLWGFRVGVAWAAFGGAATLVVVGPSGPAVGGVPADHLAAAVALAVYAVVAGLTTRFVVPVMLVRDAGVLAAWARFLRVLAANPGQYGGYLAVGLVVRFVADVLALSAAVLVAVLLAIPVAVFVVPALVVFGQAPWLALSPPLVLLTGGLSAAYVLLALLGVVLARLPFVVYVRHHALSVLALTEPDLALP
jgi:hypothetical protein